jgi:hypothetical protein
LPFLPNVILAECENWSQAVGSQELSYFASRSDKAAGLQPI